MNTLRYLLIFLTTNLFISQFVDDFKGKIEEVQIASCDSTKIEGRIWFPEKRTSDKLVIAVTPCLVTTFKPMSYSEELRFDLMLRDKLLEKGITYFEFAGRKDSITKYGRRFPLSTMFTKAKDLEATLAYVRSRGDLANKKNRSYRAKRRRSHQYDRCI